MRLSWWPPCLPPKTGAPYDWRCPLLSVWMPALGGRGCSRKCLYSPDLFSPSGMCLDIVESNSSVTRKPVSRLKSSTTTAYTLIL